MTKRKATKNESEQAKNSKELVFGTVMKGFACSKVGSWTPGDRVIITPDHTTWVNSGVIVLDPVEVSE